MSIATAAITVTLNASTAAAQWSKFSAQREPSADSPAGREANPNQAAAGVSSPADVKNATISSGAANSNASPSVTTPGSPPASPPPVAAPTVAPAHEGRFEFGSYGRVMAASDLRGGTSRGTNVVAFGPRIVDEGSYAELELRREDTWNTRVKGRVVATLALFPPFFHFSGKAAQAIGVRNLYAQGSYDDITMWAGSRMYRGDDIYLLNWWPLDQQNTVGGGIGGPIYKRSGPDAAYETILQFHAGQQRLDNIYQTQEIPVVAPFGFGTTNVVKLDRPRTIETAKLTQIVRPGNGSAGFKVVAYGELHQLPAGTYRDPLINADRGLPSDSGWLAGAQATAFTGKRSTYASFVLRHARGMAAYDPLGVPATFALDRSVSGASETQMAFSGNYEHDLFAVAFASYIRFFRDGSPSETSTEKFDEGAAVVRPSVFLGDHFGVSVEGSYQARRLAAFAPATSNPITAAVTKIGFMPYFSPDGRGTFQRPQIRLLYVASVRNSDAKALFPAQDEFSQRSVEHFLGLGAEWWFNSSSYP